MRVSFIRPFKTRSLFKEPFLTVFSHWNPFDDLKRHGVKEVNVFTFVLS